MNDCPIRAVGDKHDFHFRLDGTVRLPVNADFPCQHQTVRRLPDLYPAPIAFGTIRTPLEPPTTALRLDDRRYCVLFSKFVRGKRPPLAKVLGEYTERMCLRNIDCDGLPDGHASDFFRRDA